MIVVDANIIAYSLFGSPRTAAALSVRDRDPHWLVPPLWRSELLSILAVYARRYTLSFPECLTIWERAVRALASNECDPDARMVLELAVTRAISAYDAQYIALALMYAVPCVTEDRELLHKFPDIALSMEAFLAHGGRELKEPRGMYRRVRKRSGSRV
jgi:predicted nucleic acid-binding protein